ncbi:hypothetical protein HU734_010545 [Pseudomonas wayambapalatensis]|nr:hypothetical protein HU734_010545 [Pseudomonas wayambapalatensis]
MLEEKRKRFLSIIAVTFLCVAFIVIPIVWQLIVTLKWVGLDNAAAASWVQGVGSILAIVAAGYFPIFHSRISAKKLERQLVGTMRVLMTETLEKLWRLSSAFVKFDSEILEMQEYLRNHRQREWHGLISAIDQMPIAQLPARRVSDLGHLRDAAEFGAYVAELLPGWIESGASHQSVVRALRGKRDLLMLLRGMTPQSGVEDPNWDWIKKIQAYEISKAEPGEMIVSGVKIYRRYSWPEVGHIPKGYQLQYYFPDGLVTTDDSVSFPWSSYDDLKARIEIDVNSTISRYLGDF